MLGGNAVVRTRENLPMLVAEPSGDVPNDESIDDNVGLGNEVEVAALTGHGHRALEREVEPEMAVHHLACSAVDGDRRDAPDLGDGARERAPLR